MKRCVLILSMFVRITSWSQPEDVDSILNHVFSSLIQDNRVLLDSVYHLREQLLEQRLRAMHDTIHVTRDTAEAARLQLELNATRAWIAARAQQSAILVNLDGDVAYMDLTTWRVERISGKRIVMVRRRRPAPVSRRFEIIFMGRSVMWYRDDD
jgi:hypothetical protein